MAGQGDTVTGPGRPTAPDGVVDAAAPPGRGPLRVLLVLDQPVLAEVVKLALAHAPGEFCARRAPDAAAAGVLGRWRPHLAVVDMDLAQGEMLARLGHAAPPRVERVPVVALTRRGDLKAKLAAFDQGVDDLKDARTPSVRRAAQLAIITPCWIGCHCSSASYSQHSEAGARCWWRTCSYGGNSPSRCAPIGVPACAGTTGSSGSSLGGCVPIGASTSCWSSRRRCSAGTGGAGSSSGGGAPGAPRAGRGCRGRCGTSSVASRKRTGCGAPSAFAASCSSWGSPSAPARYAGTAGIPRPRGGLAAPGTPRPPAGGPPRPRAAGAAAAAAPRRLPRRGRRAGGVRALAARVGAARGGLGRAAAAARGARPAADPPQRRRRRHRGLLRYRPGGGRRW
jgi:hypothetical protein